MANKYLDFAGLQRLVNKIKELIPTSLPADGGDADTVGGFTVGVNVPADAKFTDTVYSHPSSHPASMITESSTKRFVSDSEKSTWDSKSDTDTVTTINGKTGTITKADITALGIPAQDTVVDISGKADITYVDGKVVPVVNALNSTSTTSALSAAQGKALNEGKAAKTEVIIVVKHGTDGNTARPVGASVVYWVGTAEPTKALNDDMWLGEE